MGKFTGNIIQREEVAGANRALDFQRVAVKMMISFESLYQEIVDREPDRTSPVRVPSE